MTANSFEGPGDRRSTDGDWVRAADARIPAQAWSEIAGLTRILADATCMLSSLRQQAQQLQRRAYMDGHAAGFERAQAESVRQALEAQVKAREFVDSAGQHIVSMALASVQRMASTLGPANMVTALLADALGAIKTERQLQVSVSQSAVKATRAMLARWQSEHPYTVVQVLVDPQLEPFGCEIASELGRIELGLRKQLEAIREELRAEASIPVAMPATAADQTDESGWEWLP
jgi:flagellar biosynthesis/type III secretory pathway protein FliH